MKCEKCGKPATVHLTEVLQGEKIEKHLCEECAQLEGITFSAEVPISQLLEEFILKGGEAQGEQQPVCDVCGMTFKEFRQDGLLGCPNDYEAFAEQLGPMIERAHGGADQHIGKVPHRAGNEEKKQNAILRLRVELKAAIAAEDYERAAALRDQIKEYDGTWPQES